MLKFKKIILYVIAYEFSLACFANGDFKYNLLIFLIFVIIYVLSGFKY